MIGLNHALAGALVGIYMPPQYIAYIPLVAFASHFILDAMPHYGRDDTAGVRTKKFRRIVAMDAILCFLAVGLVVWLYPDKLLPMGLAMFFAVLPDFLWIFHYYTKVHNRLADKFFAFAARIQWGERPWAWSLEVLYAMCMLTVIVGLA